MSDFQRVRCDLEASIRSAPAERSIGWS